MVTEHVRKLLRAYFRNAREAFVKLSMGGEQTALSKACPAGLTL